MLDRKTLYAAVKNNDARLDGKFFVGVRTTGIYCRSVCKAVSYTHLRAHET